MGTSFKVRRHFYSLDSKSGSYSGQFYLRHPTVANQKAVTAARGVHNSGLSLLLSGLFKLLVSVIWKLNFGRETVVSATSLWLERDCQLGRR